MTSLITHTTSPSPDVKGFYDRHRGFQVLVRQQECAIAVTMLLSMICTCYLGILPKVTCYASLSCKAQHANALHSFFAMEQFFRFGVDYHVIDLLRR